MAIFKARTTSDVFESGDLNRDVTAAMIYVLVGGSWQTVGKATSSDGRHAEEWFLADLQSKKPVLGINRGATVRMEITKSPCGERDHDCASQLYTYMQSPSRTVGRLVIRYLGAYNTQSGEGAMFTQAAIGMCAASGNIDIDVWEWQNDSTAAMRKFLTGFSPGVYDTNPATRGNYAREPERKALVRAWNSVG